MIVPATLAVIGSPKWTRAQRRAAWKQFDAFARFFEPTIERTARRLFDDMRERLAALTRNTLIDESVTRGVKGVTSDSVRDWQRAMGVQRKRYHAQWAAEFRALTETQAEVVGGIVSGELGVSFDLYGPHLQRMIAARPNLLSGRVTGNTFRAIKATMAEGMRLGESTYLLAQRVESVFDKGLYRTVRGRRIQVLNATQRAKLIARTEATAITNRAALMSALDSGIATDKEWLTQGDDRVRDDHIAMEGEIVPSEEPFSNGLDEPSEPMCRCTLIFHVQRRKGRHTWRRSRSAATCV